MIKIHRPRFLLTIRSVIHQQAIILLVSSSIASPALAADASKFTNKIFGENVFVFDDSMEMDKIQQKIDEIHQGQKYDEFSDNRFALLFKPGTYNLDVTVDYYVQASGLGRKPGDVTINGFVQSITTGRNSTKVTTMFWRAAENFLVQPESGKTVYWAVSQAAPYRRMHVKGNAHFDRHGWASGGFLANSVIEGKAGLDTGQQWFTRNCEIGDWYGAAWNKVFVGVKGTPEEGWPEKPYTKVDITPLVRDKPFLTFDKKDGYAVFVPKLRKDSSGVSWKEKTEKGELISLDKFYIALPDQDDAKSINLALSSGRHLLFTPGIYNLEEAIHVTRPNTVVLGLGLPSLVPLKGKPALVTDDVGGLKLAGFMVDAGPQNSPSLIQVGSQGSRADHKANPSSLSDVFCRVGGPWPGQAEVCLTINSNNVIADHLWLWRADHGAGAKWNVNKSKHGLVVNGDDVIIYGLFNEHFQEYQTLWNGERGRTYFYQSEIPYDPPNLRVWNDNGKAGFASYKVADHVQDHQAWGLGIYSFFKVEDQVDTEGTNAVRLDNSIESPSAPGIKFTHMVNFAGLNGGINHIINGLGDSTDVGELSKLESFHGSAEAGEAWD